MLWKKANPTQAGISCLYMNKIFKVSLASIIAWLGHELHRLVLVFIAFETMGLRSFEAPSLQNANWCDAIVWMDCNWCPVNGDLSSHISHKSPFLLMIPKSKPCCAVLFSTWHESEAPHTCRAGLIYTFSSSVNVLAAMRLQWFSQGSRFEQIILRRMAKQ